MLELLVAISRALALAGRGHRELVLENMALRQLRLKRRGVEISDPLTDQWWGDRTFKVLDPNGFEI